MEEDKVRKILDALATHENLIMLDDMWWSNQDIPSFDYLKKNHDKYMETLLPHIPNKKVVVQAGGHCGYVVRDLIPHFDTIYTFEPNHSMFLALCLNCTEEKVIKMQACLGEKHMLVDVAPSHLDNNAGANYIQNFGTIPMIKIDDLDLRACDLIMLDTEGYEFNILLGAMKTILMYKPTLCIERCWGEKHFGITEDQMDVFLTLIGYLGFGKVGESDYIYKYGRK
jgi:FkbM family methyltransferase